MGDAMPYGEFKVVVGGEEVPVRQHSGPAAMTLPGASLEQRVELLEAMERFWQGRLGDNLALRAEVGVLQSKVVRLAALWKMVGQVATGIRKETEVNPDEDPSSEERMAAVFRTAAGMAAAIVDEDLN